MPGEPDSENRIKELKQDLSLDTTDTAFRMGGVLYNLLADFRETVLPRCGLKDGCGRSEIWFFW